MRHVYTWGGILIVVFFSVVGDVLMARAMKRVGDVHELWDRHGLWRAVGRILSTPSFFFGVGGIGRWRFSACCSRCRGDA